jgi:hypothetical protein
VCDPRCRNEKVKVIALVVFGEGLETEAEGNKYCVKLCVYIKDNSKGIGANECICMI